MIYIYNIENYEYSETISDGQTGETLYLHPQGEIATPPDVTCTLIAGSNTGKFQFSTSPLANLKAGTATWQDWYIGNATGSNTDIFEGKLTAVRGVSVSGEVKIEVVI